MFFRISWVGGLIFKILCLQTATAQTPVDYKHLTYWSRVSVVKTFAKKWEVGAEYQHRRQNYRETDINMLQAPLLHSIRIRARYAVNENLTFTMLPFSWFYSYPLLGNEKDYLRKPDKEFRFAAQVEFRQKIGRVEVLNRYGYESRFIQRPPDSMYRSVGRIRSRLLLELPVFSKEEKKETFRPYTSCELFLNTGKNIEPTRIFEHTRLMAGLRIPLNRYIRLDTGYQYAFRVRRTGFEKDHEHTIFTYLTFVL